MKIKTIILLVSLAIVLSGCVKIGEFYVGLNMQPNMDNAEFEPGINVFGVVKCGVSFDTVNYHFEVQKVIDLMDWSDWVEVENAEIHLKRTTTLGDILDYDLSYISNAKYGNDRLAVSPGDRWEYYCTVDSFQLAAQCVVPNLPVIIKENVSGKEVNFEIEKDTTAYLYLVYAIQNDHIYSSYQVAEPLGNTNVSLSLDWYSAESPLFIYVCAYDANLRKYQTTSNTFFKPNAYRPPYTTVEGGFGTFGAISIQSMVIKE